ncbi:MAG: cell wall-binding repeat-containing protein [Coriobacteriales bacterium]|nr:cell wall-binding repeat-containing protein [Coriobacteriales bacterium]
MTDRYETAREVFNNCKREGVPLANVAIATGSSPVDSIPGAALKSPILLADPGKTSAAAGTVSHFRTAISRVLVLGGTGTVSNATATTVANAWP